MEPATGPLAAVSAMSAIRSICVYCGAEPGLDPAFQQAAADLGRMLARNKIEMIFGGGLNGLMGITARAASESGGRVTGVIPEFLSHLAEAACHQIIFTKNMHDRKQVMFDHADAFIALPGGIGTLEELAEQLKWTQLGQHTKPLFVLNVSEYWGPLLELFRHMKINNFVRENIDSMLQVCQSIDEIEAAINRLQNE